MNATKNQSFVCLPCSQHISGVSRAITYQRIKQVQKMREKPTAVWRTAPAFQISHRWAWLSILKDSSPLIQRFMSEIRVSAWFLVRPAFSATSANSNSARVWNGFQGCCVLSFGISVLSLRSWYSLSGRISAGRPLWGWYSILISSIEGSVWYWSWLVVWVSAKFKDVQESVSIKNKKSWMSYLYQSSQSLQMEPIQSDRFQDQVLWEWS